MRQDMLKRRGRKDKQFYRICVMPKAQMAQLGERRTT
jgi:ribosomal protein S16